MSNFKRLFFFIEATTQSFPYLWCKVEFLVLDKSYFLHCQTAGLLFVSDTFLFMELLEFLSGDDL